MPALTIDQAKERVSNLLRIAVGVEEFEITSAKLEEMQGVWKIDVEFRKPKAMFSESASAILDAETGDVREFRKGMQNRVSADSWTH